jgi:transposase-like protein
VQTAVSDTLEELMRAEIELFLGEPAQVANKRNGFVTRTFAIHGIGTVRLRVPRDRLGKFESKVIPARRRYDEAIEKDLALLHLAGISTRMLAMLSGRVLGVKVSAKEVSNALATIVPAAKRFLERRLDDRRFKYLYLDGTNFHVRRTTVGIEPTLVVIGIDELDRKSVLAMVQGAKESKGAWEMVFAELKERGLDPSAVQLAVMDGLTGLEDAFGEAFPTARALRCWVHKARNVLPRVPTRYQAEFKRAWDAIQYADGEPAARAAYAALVAQFGKACPEAVENLGRDIDALLAHYAFPKEHWEALRTTNPIERVNKEFKRRSKAMEQVSPDGLRVLLAFTALRLEFGWLQTPLGSNKLTHLRYREHTDQRRLAALADSLVH